MTEPDSAARIERLLASMTLPEKLGQLTMLAADLAVTGPVLADDVVARVRAGAAGSLLNLWGSARVRDMQRIAVEETRLGIPLFFGFDVVHGHRTVFPSPLGETAAFDPDLWRRTARAAAREAAADGVDIVFAPMLDVARDPRWGRIMEGPGEDAVVGARFAEAKVAGFQGGDLAAPDAVAATAKHFVGYGAVQAGREYASADLSDRTLHEVHLPPFAAAVKAGVAAIMPAFQDLAGLPMTAHRPLLRGVLRERWGFDGVLISDYGATRELLAHGVAGDLAEAAALALAAGIDIDMMGAAYADGLETALAQGLVDPALVDAAVRRVLRLKATLGLFADPYRRLRGPTGIAPGTRALAREAARRSCVLLTNRGILPLEPTGQRIAVIGPLAASGRDLLGPWAGTGEDAAPVTILAGLAAALPNAEIVTAPGTGIDTADESGISAASSLARTAGAVVLCLGEAAEMSGEAASRGRLDLPGRQQALADAVLAQGRPVVAVIVAGRPLVVPELAAKADALVMAWHPGSEGGHALADILTGAAAPTGRLPLSWPTALGQVPVFYAERPTGRPCGIDPHFASRYIDQPNEPLFPFGHGLTYTRFAWRAVRATPAEIAPGDTIAIEAEIANVGERPGEETAFLFIRDRVASVARPAMELRRFSRIALSAGETGTLRFALPAAELAFPGAPPDFAPLLEPGEFDLLVGPCADRRRLLRTAVRLRS